MTYSFSDIPDSRTKFFYPLGRHIWKMHKELGYQYNMTLQNSTADMIYPVINKRLDNTIYTTRKILEEKIPPEKTLTFMLFPPVVTQRGDLTQGSMKLLYGESCDLTFVIINDSTDGEVFFILNGHSEDGIPVDWWLEKPDSELLERRHQKLGYKLRELPKIIKNQTKCGFRIIEVLKDIRNERTPQWEHSSYHIAMSWNSGMSNVLLEQSTWEGFAEIWDGVNSKKLGLSDYWFCYVPWPAMINTLFGLPRHSWTLRITGLFLGHKFYLNGFEDIAVDWLKDNFPEVFDIAIKDQIEVEGIPLPWQTLECKPPNLKNKKVIQNENFDFKYPKPEQFLKPSDLDLNLEDILKGVFLDITHETKEKITKDLIISQGIGKDTVYLK
ncbi:MAG: hypothetical protein ACTSRG_07005 [Candidatus Helarchaeota archaeon]